MFVASNKKNKSMGFNTSGSNSRYGFKTVPNESVLWKLQSADGTDFGDVSYGAYKAVESGKLDSYKPKNDTEKEAISKFRSYLGTPLSSPSGVEFGKVSYDAYQAITNDKLDSYTPKNDTEKKTLEDFKNYATVYSADTVSGGLKYNSEIGQFGKGNIDLYNRPQHKNDDGTVSTVRSATFEIDGKYVVLPTVVYDGKSGRETSKILSDEEAIEHYKQTGQYLGKFDTLYEADIYAQKLHLAQDFYYGSKYKTTKNGKETEFSVWTPGLVIESGYDDLTYDVINKNEDAKSIQAANDIAINATIAGADKGFLQTMTDDEVAVFNYIYSTQGADKAYEFINDISADLNYRQRVKTEKMWADEAANAPVKMSAFSVLISPLKMASYVGQVADYVDDGSIDQNAGYNKYVHIPNAIRNEVSTQIENSGNWGTVGSYAYNIGMSMADSLYNTAISGGQQWLSLAIMGTGAAADTTVAAKDRGLSDTQAFWLGTISGAGEIISEKMSFDAIMDADLFTQSARKYFVRSATVGGLEEVVADGINFAADTIIAGDKSLWSQSIKSYMQQGKTKSEAVGLTLGNKLLETALSFAGGALSTGVMSLGGTVYNTSRIRDVGKQYNSSDDISKVIEKGLKQPTDSAAYQNAVKLQEKMKSGTLTDFEIGQQVLLNEGATVTDEAEVAETKVNRAKKLIDKFSSYIHKSDATTTDTTVETSTPVVAETAPVVETTTSTADISTIPVAVGDTFHDTKTGTTLTVISRDANNTVVRVNESGIEKTYTNDIADMMSANPTFEKVDGTSDITAPQNTESAETVTMADGTTAHRIGDFYEVYGTEAEAIAEKLNLTVTPKIIDGVKTPMVGFPVHAFDTYNSRLNSVTSINEQNMPVTDENTPVNEVVTDTDVNYAEGEILSLKHTKNIYSVFKNAARMVVGKDVITDGFFAVPLSDEALAEVKKVYTGNIENNNNIELAKFYHADNDVVIQGNPKIDKDNMGRPEYVFKIGDKYYAAQQKYIDAVNNGKNIIKANSKQYNIPWTVHDESGNFVAIIMPIIADKQDGRATEHYESLQSVSDVKTAEQQKKADNAAKPFNQNEIRLLFKEARPYFFNANGSTYVGNNSLYAVCDTEAVEFLKTEYRNRNTNSNYEIEFSDSFGSRVEKLLSDVVTIAEASKPISYNLGDKDVSAYVIGDYAIAFDKNYANFVKKRSATMKIVSEGNLATTLLVGYDADGTVTAFALPILAQGEITARDGTKYPFATSNSIKKTVKESKDSVTKTPETVTETPESVTNAEKTEENTPVAEEKTEYKHLYNEETVSEDFINSVNPEIESAILNIRNGNTDAVPDVVEVTELTEKTIEKISDFVGFDVSGYSCKIEKDALQHIENRHGINGSHDQSLSDPKDTARMGYIVNNSDSVDWIREKDGAVKTSKKYRDKNNKPAKLVMVQKKIDGTYCVSDVVPDSKNKTIWVTSARIQKKHQDLDDNNVSPKTTPENALNASDTIIAEEAENVNTSEETTTPTLTDKVGDEIKLSDYEKTEADEQGLNNEPESDTIVSETTKEDFKVGDILEFDGEQWKCVNIDSTMIDFENVDKNAFQPELSVISPYELFKEKTDYIVIKESAENVESQSEILDRESKSDGGRLHAGASESAVETGNEEADEPHRDRSGKGLSESVGTDGNRPDVRNDSERIYGTDDADDAVSEVRGNSAEITDSEFETIDTEVKTVEKKRPSNKGNFVITDDIATEFDNTAPSARDNIEAIELLLKLESEGRPATAEEKKILAKYKGWGGIDPRHIPYELSSRFGQLFDWEQRKAMQSSSNNAFFTPTGVIDAMYNGLKRMGFKGGNVLETSMGVGNFFGRMPSAISAKSALTGVELESYTARIAQYLYPGATVINMPFQDVAIKNGSYDLVIGNVPFGTNKISYNKKKYSLHNYFIISSLDKVRDGGIVAVITSAGTLDSHSIDARAAIMDRADVVACYKLPEKVFSRNASTDVQSDLLILRKRSADEKPKGDSILNTITTAQGFRINEYFDKHPENVLGTLAKGHNAWGEITTVLNDGNFYDKLNAAMKKLPKDLISGKIDLKPIETIVSLSDKPRFFEKNGKIYADDGAGTATEVSKNQANTVRDYIAVRDAYKELLSAYDNGETVINADGTATIREMSDEDIKPLRDALSKAYDNFYKKHGAITGDGKKKIGTKKSTNNTFLEADADYYLVGGLERYDAKNSTFVKSALFEKDTLRKKRVTSVDVASDALAVSLNESGRIDFARMQELTGKTEKQLAEELKGEIVLTPDGEYVLTDIYLSGNIYEKLDAVKNKPEFKAQQEMLEKVIPTPKDASEITVKLGANYIDTEYIEQFAREILNTNLTIRKDVSGRWVIEGVKQSRYGDIVNVKYGCAAFNAVQLLEKILNDGEITATKKIGTGRDAVTVFDPEMTDVARQKADDIRAAFETWIFSNSERRTEIVDNYNRTYNNYRPLDYERIAEKLSFDSMDETLKSKLYSHQKKGIARFLFGGNILFAHGVGTGKTFEMIASVMEAKRMGIINKAAMVVPNNKVVDFKNDIAQAYPNAKVLVIDTANKKRQTMLGLVNSNDWDIVLIARTTFTKIPISPEFQTHYVAQQLEDLELQIAEAESDKNVSRRQLKGMITQRDNLEQKIKDLDAETKRDTNSVDFEKLGIDCICVDEAHNYKSILTPTKLSIKGLVNRNNAQMANDMLMKLDYLRSIDGKIIFGTGTPITNTVSEIYNMMRMVRPDILEDAGIHSLDEWVNTFAKIDTVTEIGIDNQIKAKSTQIIRSFINVSEMIGMFRQFADIVFTTDVVKNLPKAVYKDVELAGTDKHKQIEKQISEVIAKTEKSDLLKVYGQLMSMADAASVDLRMLSGAESEYNIFKDYSLEELDYEDSKINVMCDNVYDEYTASNDIKGTQIIFCDKGSGSGTVYSFNLHKDIMQKLVERGIPEEQIAIIKSQSDAQLEVLYDKVNAGDVRVLIGTSQKMAEGLNVQKRVVAIHHPTVTYKPSDKEQGDARGVRAGNINDEVHIYRYLQKNTFDSHKWQAQDRKGEMINKALRGEVVAEMEDIGADEDSGAGVDAATAMAITSGNPLVKEKIGIDKEVVRLKTLQRNYLSEVYRYQDAISKNPNMIRQLTNYADNIEQDIALRNKYGEKASVVIKGKTFEKQTDANKALSEAVKTAPKNGQYTKLGTYNGFDIMFKGDTGGMGYSVILKGSNEYSVDYAGSGNNMARFAGVLNRLDAELTRVRERVETLKTDLEFAKKEVLKPFEKEKELTEALEKQKDITYRYEHYSDKPATNAETSDTDNSETVQSSRDLASGDSAERWTTERVEGNEGKGVNLADIVRSISKKFDIPIATGKVTDSEASGIYKRKAETIRTRIANNLPTISHELGHHLDKDYNFSNMESVELLKSSLPADFLEQYEEADRGREAVAEFVRVYLKNTNNANRLCPEFYADFISTLSKEDLKSLNEIAASVNEYLSYNISERYDAAITTSKKQEKLSFKEKWQRLYTSWVDAFHPQKEAVDYVEEVTGQTLSGKGNAYVLATNSLNAHTISNYLICEGFRDLDGNIVDAKSFVESIGMVDSKNVALLDKYLVLRHSLEWIAPTESDVAPKRVFADDTLENVEEIEKQIAQIEAEHPEIKTAAENLYEYQNNVLRHFVVPAGGMSEETLDMLNRKYPSYVPFYRAVGKKSGMAKGTFVNQRSPIMRAKGSGALILSPVESIIRNTEKMVKLALRNQTARVLSSYADTVDGFGQFMEAIPPDMIPHSVNIVKSKESFTDALQQIVSSGEDYFAVSDLFEQIFGNEVTDFTPVANANKRIVTVLQDGKPTYYQIHDEALYNAVAELAPQQANGYVKWATKIMQPMKLLITQNNPIFAVTNAIRDFGTAYKLSEVNNLAVFAAQYVKALGGIITNNADYKRYKAMGGGHSSELSANIDSIARTLRTVAHKDMGKARRLAYSLFVHPVETVAMFNDAIESVPRFAEFQRTLKEGGDLQEAIFNASDITTNFKRSGGGVGVKIANSTFMFNNAAIQGIDKTFRTLTNKDPKKRYRTLLKWLLHALLTGIIGYIYNKEVDEEGYKNLSSYKKNNFYNFAIGDGKFISLPKPRENALLDTFTERAIEYAFGNENAFYDFSTYLGGQLIPPMIPDDLKSIEDAAHSWLGGTVLGGIVDVGFNQDFKDTPIEGAYDIYTPSHERYTESTTKLAYALGQTRLARNMDMSPKKIDHLLSSYTGILGQINKALFPMNEERKDTSIGLRNKFISDSNYSTDVLNRMYENQEKAEKAFTYSGTIDTAIEYEKNSIITSYISGMNKAVKALPKDEQRNGRIYLLKALNSWNYENTASQTNMLSSLDGSSISTDMIFDELPSSTLEWTVNKQKYVYQMTPQEYHKYINDYLTAIENARKQYGCDSVESCEMAKEAAKEYMSKYKKGILKNQYFTKAVEKTE